MAQLSVTIPDAVAPRLLDALADKYGYDPANGKTKAQFAQSVVRRWLRAELEGYEGSQAERDARQEAVDAIRAEMPDE